MVGVGLVLVKLAEVQENEKAGKVNAKCAADLFAAVGLMSARREGKSLSFREIGTASPTARA
jgi:hypothetical protein